MEVSIPLVLIEVSPFLLLPTLRALARAPEPSGGGVEGSPHFGENCRGCERRLETATNIEIYGLSCITGITCIEVNPVENFGAPEAIISMHGSTKKR